LHAGFAVKELNDFHYATAATVDLPHEDAAAIAATKWVTVAHEHVPRIEASKTIPHPCTALLPPLRRHTVQGVDVQPYSIVTGPNDWKAQDFRGDENAHKWQYHLTDDDIAEVEAALAAVKQRGLKIEVRQFVSHSIAYLTPCLMIGATITSRADPQLLC
jgi:hypothetical protein